MPLSKSIARLALLEVKLAKENIAEQLAQYKRDCEADPRPGATGPAMSSHGLAARFASTPGAFRSITPGGPVA